MLLQYKNHKLGEILHTLQVLQLKTTIKLSSPCLTHVVMWSSKYLSPSHLLPSHLVLRSVSVHTPDDSLPSTASPGRLLVSLLLGTCAMLVKETGVTVFGVCVLYDVLVLCRKPLIK